jgi:hypothetical protein
MVCVRVGVRMWGGVPWEGELVRVEWGGVNGSIRHCPHLSHRLPPTLPAFPPAPLQGALGAYGLLVALAVALSVFCVLRWDKGTWDKGTASRLQSHARPRSALLVQANSRTSATPTGPLSVARDNLQILNTAAPHPCTPRPAAPLAWRSASSCSRWAAGGRGEYGYGRGCGWFGASQACSSRAGGVRVCKGGAGGRGCQVGLGLSRRGVIAVDQVRAGLSSRVRLSEMPVP